MIKRAMPRYFEEIFWTSALAVLFFMDTSSEGYSFCLFKLMGFKSCIGCGLGHSIHYALHLDFPKSFTENPIGIPVSLLLIIKIVKPFFHLKNKNINGYQTNVGIAARNSD
jgi:hypothetical protein